MPTQAGQLATVADVASIVTGLTTIALVVVTYVAVRSGRASAEAAALSAELAARELQEAHRPVLIPEAPSEDDRDLVVVVSNIGIGPLCGSSGGHRPGTFRLTSLPGSRSTRSRALKPVVRRSFDSGGVPLPDLLSLKVVFDDVLGKTYTTDARWDGIKKAFVYAGVAEGDSARVPVKIGVSEQGITVGVGSQPPTLIERPHGGQAPD